MDFPFEFSVETIGGRRRYTGGMIVGSDTDPKQSKQPWRSLVELPTLDDRSVVA